MKKSGRYGHTEAIYNFSKVNPISTFIENKILQNIILQNLILQI